MTRLHQTDRVATRHLIRGEIAGHFLDAHAISPDDAIRFVPRPADERRFARLRETVVIRETRPGHFWFDLSEYYTQQEARRRWMVPLLLIGAVVLAAVATLFYRG